MTDTTTNGKPPTDHSQWWTNDAGWPAASPVPGAAAPEPEAEPGWGWDAEPATTPPEPPPPPPAPPRPATVRVAPARPTAVVPDQSPPPPRHAKAPPTIAVPDELDPDGDGWVAGPPLEDRRPAVRPAEKPAVAESTAVAKTRPSVSGAASKLQRSRWTARVAVIVVVLLFLVVVLRMVVGQFGSAVNGAMRESSQEQTKTMTSVVEAAVAPKSSTVNITNPLSWLPCPLTPDAMGIIGYDPPEGPTLNAARARGVDQQAHLLLAAHNASEMRIQQPDATHIVVFVGNPTAGVPLIDCSQQGVVPAQTTPTTGR